MSPLIGICLTCTCITIVRNLWSVSLLITSLRLLYYLTSFWTALLFNQTYRHLHCNCRSKCILFKMNNTIYNAWEKSHTSLLAMKMKVSLILIRKLYVHVTVAALQMDEFEVFSRYKSHPHSRIYLFKNDNLR